MAGVSGNAHLENREPCPGQVVVAEPDWVAEVVVVETPVAQDPDYRAGPVQECLASWLSSDAVDEDDADSVEVDGSGVRG